MNRLYLGIDVGSSSARAGLFDATGQLVGQGVAPFEVFRPEEGFAEHRSNEIWRACCDAVGSALRRSGARPELVRGVGFDATCSLVALGEDDAPVCVSPSGDPACNVIVWMDHRATDQARRIDLTGHPALRHVGGRISPEMQTPKLLWLLEHMPEAFARTRRFFDLPDWLTYRATGEAVRSLCSTVCKWTYDGTKGWDPSYFRAIGLGSLADEGFARIGTRVRPMGERVGGLTVLAAAELGLLAGTPVGVSMIDAHAGGIGVLGARLEGEATPDFETRLALIGGTSTCHMAVSREPRFIPGIWGPYFSAMVPGLWLTEGGQSATGALIDHVIATHSAGVELLRRAHEGGPRPSRVLDAIVAELARDEPFSAALTRGLHVYPDHHGNRSPRADASLRGMVSGLSLTDSVESLARLYLATVQALAYGTRAIVDTMNRHGYRIDTLMATGGDAKNPLFLREHADATGCRIVLPREEEAVLLGSSMLGAVASGDQPDLAAAMEAMGAAARVVEPSRGPVRAYHNAKYGVFHRMVADQLDYRELMEATLEP